MATHELKPTTCTQCKTELPLASNTTPGDTRPPRKGDVTMCLSCANIMVFEEDGTLRPPTEDELAAISADPRVAKLIDARLAVMGQRKH